jgi:hypothetical protein
LHLDRHPVCSSCRYTRVHAAAGDAADQQQPQGQPGAIWSQEPHDIGRLGKPRRCVWVDENVVLWEVKKINRGAQASAAPGSSPNEDDAAADAVGTSEGGAAGGVAGTSPVPEGDGQSASAGAGADAGAAAGRFPAAGLAGTPGAGIRAVDGAGMPLHGAAGSAGSSAAPPPSAAAAGAGSRGTTRQREASPEPQLTVAHAEQGMMPNMMLPGAVAVYTPSLPLFIAFKHGVLQAMHSGCVS